MFNSIRQEKTLRDVGRWLLLPIVVAVIMDIPMEIDLYAQFRLRDAAPMHFAWLYFHTLIVAIVSFGLPLVWGTPTPLLFTKDEDSWLMTIVNIAFYVLLTIWCRYSIVAGYTVGVDAAEFRRYRPFWIGLGLAVLGSIGLGWVATFDRFPPDLDVGFVFYVVAYTGLVLTVSSIIIVTGRRARFKRVMPNQTVQT